MQSVSKIRPNVSKSLIRSDGPIPNEAVAIDGSVKYRVSEVRIAVFERRFGFQASTSSMTNILLSAFM